MKLAGSFPFYFDPTSEHDEACVDYTLLPPTHPGTSIKLLEREDMAPVAYGILRRRQNLDPQATELGDQLEIAQQFKTGAFWYIYTLNGLTAERGWACDLAAEMDQWIKIQVSMVRERESLRYAPVETSRSALRGLSKYKT